MVVFQLKTGFIHVVVFPQQNYEMVRTRQIIRYRATATLRRPQNKQYLASK